MNNKLLTYIFLISIFCCVINPVVLSAQQKELYTLSVDEFMGILSKFHPIIRQTDINIEVAKNELLSARGAFDPVFNYKMDRKTFDGKNYFTYQNPEIKIPTWFGIEIKTGMENNSGDFTNPEITKGVSSYLGIKLPLAKNLIIDERRALLEQSKLFITLSKIEKELLINDLYYGAINAYWNWVMEFNTLKALDSVVSINEQRFRFIKLLLLQGDIPAIDTVEAHAQLQTFIIQQQESLYRFIVASFQLSNYMWLNDTTPFEVNGQVIPVELLNNIVTGSEAVSPLLELIELTINNHPKLKKYQNKIQILEIDKKLNFQNMLPQLDLKANLLNDEYYVWKGASSQLYENNYKFGFDINIPLRFSEGRGKFRATQFKIQGAEYGLMQERLELINKLNAIYQEVLILQKQLSLASSNFKNYSILFKGETTRFSIGESSLFLLNMRENKMLESWSKLIEIQTKYLQSRAGLIWATGQFK